ncbi:hypothetical protein KIF59_02310 [Enterobacter cloacae subsp. cloacae]|nr:hypothetical protein [Enterobacter cloacae subsp. cloacae]
MPVNAGWQRWRQAVFICWRAYSVDHYRADGGPAAELGSGRWQACAAGHHRRSLYQALHNKRSVTRRLSFLMTASGVTLLGIGSCILGAGAGRRVLRRFITLSPRVTVKASSPSRCESGC